VNRILPLPSADEAAGRLRWFCFGFALVVRAAHFFEKFYFWLNLSRAKSRKTAAFTQKTRDF